MTEENLVPEREEAMAMLYADAAYMLQAARHVIARRDAVLKKYGDAPPWPAEGPDENETRRIAAMGSVEELLNDPVHGTRVRLALSH